MYVGSSQARAILRQYEFFYPKQAKVKKVKDKGKKKVPGESKQDLVKFDVLLTSYEMINLDTAILRALKWECLVNFLLLRLLCDKGAQCTICTHNFYEAHQVIINICNFGGLNLYYYIILCQG